MLVSSFLILSNRAPMQLSCFLIFLGLVVIHSFILRKSTMRHFLKRFTQQGSRGYITFHPEDISPRDISPRYISPHVHFTPRTFHPTYVSPHVHFTPRTFHPRDMSLRIKKLVWPNNILYKPVSIINIFMPID